MKKQERGITLIALVVTIVVLLILAAVSISMLGGENGIITQAQNAKLETRAGEVEERVNLWKSEKISSKYTNATVKTEDELLEKMKTDKILFEEEIDRENKIITIGTREISYKIDEETDVGKEALKFLVNSGEDGIVYMPIAIDDYGQYQIDWGDGTTGIDGTVTGGNRVEVASLDNTFVALYQSPAIGHTYAEKNKEYVVTITGYCNYISTNYPNCTPGKIIEVLQWGETGLGAINLSDCINLKRIASPTENSFIDLHCFDEDYYGSAFGNCISLTEIPEDLFENCPNAKKFEDTFSGCTSLTSIPENLFANCLNVTSFEGTFSGCTSLTSIPENLFANCSNVQNFAETFCDCTGLTGDSINLWERVENGSTNDYIGIPDGVACYYGCDNLNNYSSIPYYWKNKVK